jgi:hypothetical protein
MQVLDCDSPAHITASANLWLSSGKHCWQVVLLAPCDLVWLGVGDGSLAPDVWGEQLACCLQPAAELWQCMEFVRGRTMWWLARAGLAPVSGLQE